MLSKRERIIAIVAIATLGILGADRFVLSPVLERREALAAEKALLVQELTQGARLLQARRDAERRWRQMQRAGLQRNEAAAESALLHAIRDWGREAGLHVSSLQPERVAAGGPLQEVAYLARARGSLESIVRFLHLMQIADEPVRTREVQLIREEQEEVTLRLRISTLFLDDGEGDDDGGTEAGEERP